MPEEIVYDQDHLITVSEHAGDMILTGEFQAYKQERKFRVHLCRKADPESKGKVESTVKYVKRNFADSRIYTTIENWNERCLTWLERTGNHSVHGTTKKRPSEVFLLEKQHLKPVSKLLSNESITGSSITRTVNKDNTVYYKSNRYSVPLGTYRPKGLNTVSIEIDYDKCDQKRLIIRKNPDGEVLTNHHLETSTSKLIKNKNHGRDRSKGIQSYKETVARQFKDLELVSRYIDVLMEKYPRYKRDQLSILQKATSEYPAVIDDALHKCMAEHLMSANDFIDVAKYLNALRKETQSIPATKEIRSDSVDFTVETHPMSTYTEILGGAAY